jgi:hypothetical protein
LQIRENYEAGVEDSRELVSDFGGAQASETNLILSVAMTGRCNVAHKHPPRTRTRRISRRVFGICM